MASTVVRSLVSSALKIWTIFRVAAESSSLMTYLPAGSTVTRYPGTLTGAFIVMVVFLSERSALATAVNKPKKTRQDATANAYRFLIAYPPVFFWNVDSIKTPRWKTTLRHALPSDRAPPGRQHSMRSRGPRVSVPVRFSSRRARSGQNCHPRYAAERRQSHVEV